MKNNREWQQSLLPSLAMTITDRDDSAGQCNVSGHKLANVNLARLSRFYADDVSVDSGALKVYCRFLFLKLQQQQQQ